MSARNFKRRFHQQVADFGAAIARIYHHIFYNRCRLQSAGQMPENEDVICPHDSAFLDCDQQSFVGSLQECAHRATHLGGAWTLVGALMELPVEFLDSAFVAQVCSTNPDLLSFHLYDSRLVVDAN